MPNFYRKVKEGVVIDASEKSIIEAPSSTPKLPAAAIDLRRMIDAAVTEDDWIAIFSIAKGRALNGERLWAEFLTKYRWGLPPQMVQHGGKINAGVVMVEVVKRSDDDGAEIEIGDDTDIVDGEAEQIE